MFFEVYEFRFKYNGFYTFMVTSGFDTTHVVVPGHCNEKFCFEIFYISEANEHQN